MNGTCLCAAVRFSSAQAPFNASMCHCSQCRKQTGHYWASAQLPYDELTIEGPVRWFASSETAQRGFCELCGSFLFWKANDEDTISVSLGALETPTGVQVKKHIFVADKGDYYTLNDGLPQKP